MINVSGKSEWVTIFMVTINFVGYQKMVNDKIVIVAASSLKSIGTFHTLSQELHESLIAVGWENISRKRKSYNEALE